jgi:protein-histidine N-methyltransferase
VSVAGEEDQAEHEEEELDITPELLQSFRADIAKRGITIEFISGAWSPAFADLVFSSGDSAKGRALVLASETIYSPASLSAFSETLLALLRRPAQVGGKSRALVAAKKVYFGVGGGVDEFLAVFNTVGGSELDVKERLDIKSEGVGRIVLEIAPNNLA